MIQNLNTNEDINNYKNQRSYIFLDIRLPDKDHDSKTGFLPMTVILDKDELDDINV